MIDTPQDFLSRVAREVEARATKSNRRIAVVYGLTGFLLGLTIGIFI